MSELQESHAALQARSSYHRSPNPVQVLTGTTLVLLLVQFLSGMWINLFGTLPSMNSSQFLGMMGMMGMMSMSGSMYLLMVHVMTGYLVFFLSVLILVLSIYSGNRLFTLLSVAGIGSVVFAGVSGLLFMLSAFQNDVYSYLMAMGFAFGFVAYSLELTSAKR